MDETYKVLIATLLGLGCVAIFLFEIVKRMETEITVAKCIAMGIAACYVVAACFVGIQALPFVLYVLFSLGLIWFGDELGAMTGMSMRGGTINKASPGFLVRLFGWVFLFAPVGLAIYVACISDAR